MIDEYQILEAKALGADIILLIAAILTPDEIEDLAVFAKSLGFKCVIRGS
jgi:indole-3-glycerol phosphate synthase